MSGYGLVPHDYQRTLVAQLVRLCRQSSASGDREGLFALAQTLARMFDELSLHVQLEEQHGLPLLHAFEPSSPEPYLLLVGHLDTVLDAVPVQQEGDRLYATGAVDMKGGLVVLWGALSLLKRQGVPFPRGLRVLLVPDEESEGKVTRHAMARWGQQAQAVLVLEPGERTPVGETLVVGRKGLAEFTVSFKGRASHSGLAFRSGQSAVLAAARWIVRAEQLAKSEPQATLNAARLVAGDAEFVENLPREAKRFSSASKLNIVPDLALLRGEFRFATGVEGQRLHQKLVTMSQTLANKTGVEVSFQLDDWVTPVEAAAGMPMAEMALRLAATCHLHLTLETDRGGVSLANFLQRNDVPVLDGLGPVGGGMHTRHEYVELPSLFRRVTLLALILQELGYVDAERQGRKSFKRKARAEA